MIAIAKIFKGPSTSCGIYITPGDRRMCMAARYCLKSVGRGDVRLFAHQVGRAPLILVADVFEQLGVWDQMQTLFHGEGLRVRLWIVDGRFDLQSPKVRSPKAFGHAQGVGMRMTLVAIEPCFVVEAGG